MSSADPFDLWNRRLAAYGYLAPLVAGRRVLEVGPGGAAGAERLRSLDAAAVTSVEPDRAGLGRARASAPYDLVLVPEGSAVVAGNGVAPAALRDLLAPDGRLVVMAESADRPGARGGAAYYDVVEALEPLFPSVRMFGLTPF